MVHGVAAQYVGNPFCGVHAEVARDKASGLLARYQLA